MGVAIVVAGWVVACLGDDPKPGTGGGSNADAGASSSSGEAGPTACVPAGATTDVRIPCGSSTCTTECCLDVNGPSACDGACPAIAQRRSFKCDSKFQCVNSGEECCLAVTQQTSIDLGVCPSPVPFVSVVESACVAGGCDTSGGSGQFKMCRSDNECPAPTRCRPIEVSHGTAGTKLRFAVCR